MLLPLARPTAVAKNDTATRTGVRLSPSTASRAFRLRTRAALFNAAIVLLSVDRASRTLEALRTTFDVSKVRTTFVTSTTVRSEHGSTSYTAVHSTRRARLIRKDGSEI